MADQAVAETVTLNRPAKGRVAWCISPVLSGVTTAYRVVGKELRQRGWQVLGVTTRKDATCSIHPGFEDEPFQVFAMGNSGPRRVAADFVRWVCEQGIDVVVSTGHIYAVAAAPALPAKVRFVYRCPSITRHAYQVAATNIERTDKIIAASPRQCSDLARDWGVPPEKCALIPLGVEVEKFAPSAERDLDGPVRLIFLGRLDENSKAIMTLAGIATALEHSSVDFHLDVIGDGPDGARLQEAFGRLNLQGRATFHGSLEHSKTVPLLQAGHVFILPSRYESQSWSLLEAMACGCVPVASRIEGVTDFAVRHGVNGFLCGVGKVSDFSTAIAKLAGDRHLLRNMSDAAHKVVGERFSAERSGALYDGLFTALMSKPQADHTPIPLSDIEPPRIFEAGLRRFIPQTMKNQARTWAERLGISV